MTERQMRWEMEKERYNTNLRSKVVTYLGCTITHTNIAGYGYFVVKTTWGSWIDGETYRTITEAKKAVKRAYERYQSK